MSMECCFCKEYADMFDNQYYNELGRQLGVDSRILVETQNWYAVPTLGCLTTGYVLLICKQHYQSLANLSEALYREMLDLKGNIEKMLFAKLGLPCLAFEHGAADSRFIGANSVNHVHLHIVPFSKIIWTELAQKHELYDFELVADYMDLFLKWEKAPPKTYLLFQDINKAIYYKQDADGVPSQFFRKCLSPYLNASQWDWKQEYYLSNFIKTMELFK